jgi:hypothetical protein
VVTAQSESARLLTEIVWIQIPLGLFLFLFLKNFAYAFGQYKCFEFLSILKKIYMKSFFVTQKTLATKFSIDLQHHYRNEKHEIPCTTEEGSIFFGCWSVDKCEKLIVGSDSVQNF